MNIFKLEKSLQIDFVKPVSIEEIILKYNDYLSSMNFKTDFELNQIRFIRKNRYRGEALKVFRDGAVFIFFANDKLNINWSVELDIMYYLSALTGFFLGFVTNLILNAPFFASTITGFTGLALMIILGIFSIIGKINEININCLYLAKNEKL
jgi:hypothetical protein